MKKSSEIRQGKKALISAFDLFLTAITKVSFLEGILGTVLSLKSFGNSWENSYNKFVILGIKFQGFFGESDLYLNTLKFQNVMTKIAWIFFSFLLSTLPTMIEISGKSAHFTQIV